MRGWRTLLALSIALGACSDDTVAPKPDVLSADLAPREAAVADRARDQPTLAELTRLATFNAGLAAGAVPYAKERILLIIDALKALDAELLCLQEVWTDADAQAIQDGLKAHYPYSFREKTEDTSTAQVRCADPTKLGALVACRDAKCSPGGLSATACVTGPCNARRLVRKLVG